MKAYMNEEGRLHLVPETSFEAYALAQWAGAYEMLEGPGGKYRGISGPLNLQIDGFEGSVDKVAIS